MCIHFDSSNVIRYEFMVLMVESDFACAVSSISLDFRQIFLGVDIIFKVE